MKQSIILLLLGMIAGFLLHALVFPDFLTNGIVFLPPADIPITGAPQPTLEPNTTIITYDGTFSRHNITVPFSRYLIIRNDTKDHPMSLSSNLPSLITPRAYGEKEQIKSRMDKKGQFQVWDTANSSERLIITVK